MTAEHDCSTADYADQTDRGAVVAATWFRLLVETNFISRVGWSELHELSAFEGVYVGRIQVEPFSAVALCVKSISEHREIPRLRSE